MGLLSSVDDFGKLCTANLNNISTFAILLPSVDSFGEFFFLKFSNNPYFFQVILSLLWNIVTCLGGFTLMQLNSSSMSSCYPRYGVLCC